MSQSEQLVRAVKRQLKARGLRYADLAARLGVSEPTVKRLLSRGGITLERLDRICEALETDFFELARTARQVAEQPRELSLDQEEALAADPRLLTVFHLLCNEWDVPAIRREFRLKASDTVRLLARLDRLRLIELLPKDAIRLRVARDFAWRAHGPVRRRYARAALAEFLAGAFEGRDALLRIEIKELGDASLGMLRRRLERLAMELNEMAEVDATLAPTRRRSVGLVLAVKPWVFSLLDALRADRGATSAA